MALEVLAERWPLVFSGDGTGGLVQVLKGVQSGEHGAEGHGREQGDSDDPDQPARRA
jgi:hypothetical protein